MKRYLLLSAAFLPVMAVKPVRAQISTPLDSTIVSGFRWRSIGPANMGGRITDIEGIGSPSKTFFVAAATGGIWKTTNNGTTFRSVFDVQRVAALGDIAISPSDTNIVWAGTGEEDSRNSISAGGGIYKSTDGGLTWEFKGLEGTQVIGRIIVHPTNPDIVYVAALGHVWNSNRERGLYKTTDGGETWKLVKFVSDRAGFVDIAMHPNNPDILLASSWERVRGPYFLNSGGPGSALWKTTDGGATWSEVEGNGFPEGMKGRIGVAIAMSNPDIVYALVEAKQKAGSGLASGLYRSDDGGDSWTKMNSNNSRPFYYSQVRVDPKNPDRVYWSSTPVNFSDDGGKTVRNATVGVHVDHHAMWIDPNDPEHFVIGNDGGVAQTWDRGGNYDFLNIIALAQFYAVSYDMAIPYNVCGGLQDNGSWCGPSRRRQGAITNAMWNNVGGGDGFYTAQDPENPNIVYVESQGGNMSRLDLSTGERTSLQKPDWRATYRQFEDSIIIERGDTTKPASRATKRRIADLRNRAAADSLAHALRWNWSTPFFLSPHSPTTLYAGSNRVMKSTKRGEDMYPISPDLTTRDTMRIRVSTTTTGGITRDVTGAETHSTIVTLAESPLKPGLLYAGTDDGNVWMTRNDGGLWENLTGRFPGAPKRTWVSRIEPSHFDTATFYVSFDNHRENDFAPYVFVTDDGGKTFRSIAANLPSDGPDFIHVIREDPVNRNLLFVGTDVGVYMSGNAGRSWQRFMVGLPTVPVHDLKIHPRAHDLIAGTHGRGVWIVNIGPLEQMNDAILAEGAVLFKPPTAYEYSQPPVGGGSPAQKSFQARSPQYGAEIAYLLTSGNRRSRPTVVITDVKGDTVQTLQGTGGPGLHRVTWNFQGKRPPAPPLSPSQKRDSIIAARRIAVVFDSLAEAGVNKQMLSRMRSNIESGNTRALFRAFGGGGGRFGRRAGGPQGFIERPAESSARGGRGRQGGRGRGGLGNAPDIRQIFRLLRTAGSRGRFGFGFGGRRGRAGPVVQSGDYLVSITVDGKTLTQVLRVERANGTGGGPGFGFDDGA
ncbi:MAG: WD40/YVTN/BNR-like repeat-containing protein [Gemmatimonadales bacterium]